MKRHLYKNQPSEFSFNQESMILAEQWLKKYPDERKASAVIPLLMIAQKQHDNWLPRVAMEKVAHMLNMPPMRVLEVATFYTMFNLAPVGQYHFQLCHTTPCWLSGSDILKKTCERLIGPEGTTRQDGLFSWISVECLGACVDGPVIQVNDDYIENLNDGILESFIKHIEDGHPMKDHPAFLHKKRPFALGAKS